ncbi:MAG: hypothetical protein AAF741_18495 [Bacteroidota bacterium]
MPQDDSKVSFYAFFTKYSLVQDYGFLAGLWRRLLWKLLPPVPEKGTISYVLYNNRGEEESIRNQLPWGRMADQPLANELNRAIQALCAKLAAFGLDSAIKHKISGHSSAELNPFQRIWDLSHRVEGVNENLLFDLDEALRQARQQIVDLRQNKNKSGTSLRLTITTRRMLEYTDRARTLVQLKQNLEDKALWAKLFSEFQISEKQNRSILRYINRHLDLLALETVEHTSNKGEKYIAENKKEYLKFGRKALGGGALIAIFALVKLWLDAQGLSKGNNAILFSLNYAACFIVVKQLGGIIATKQPAMTASTIADYVDKCEDSQFKSLDDVLQLIRRVFQSQILSLVGNFIMALLSAIAIYQLLDITGANTLTSTIKPDYLIKNTTPSLQLFGFAALAGIFLATSGLISGYIDNKVVASNVGYRIKHSRLFFKSAVFAKWFQKNIGSILGNISLGFMLGSVFLLSDFLPFKVDIRHIAFSTSYVGYALMKGKLLFSVICFSLLGAILIGLTNFLVSFGLTLYLALRSRGARLTLLPRLLGGVLKDFAKRPLAYIAFR